MLIQPLDFLESQGSQSGFHHGGTHNIRSFRNISSILKNFKLVFARWLNLFSTGVQFRLVSQ